MFFEPFERAQLTVERSRQLHSISSQLPQQPSRQDDDRRVAAPFFSGELPEVATVLQLELRGGLLREPQGEAGICTHVAEHGPQPRSRLGHHGGQGRGASSRPDYSRTRVGWPLFHQGFIDGSL